MWHWAIQHHHKATGEGMKKGTYNLRIPWAAQGPANLTPVGNISSDTGPRAGSDAIPYNQATALPRVAT